MATFRAQAAHDAENDASLLGDRREGHPLDFAHMRAAANVASDVWEPVLMRAFMVLAEAHPEGSDELLIDLRVGLGL